MTSKTVDELSKEVTAEFKFDYYEVKIAYLKKLAACAGTCKLLDRPRLFKFIRTVRKAEQNISRNIALSREQERMRKLFELIETNNAHTLIKARKSPDEPIRQYVPCEDSFHILYEAHIATGHGGREKMHKQVNTKYVINKAAIEFFILSCNVCQNRRTREEIRRKAALTFQLLKHRNVTRNEKFPPFNRNCYTFLLGVSKADGSFNHILVVRDAKTGFTQLRPLVTADEIEVSVELMKIFMDFGPPHKISVSNTELFEAAIKVMTHFCPEFQNIYVERIKKGLKTLSRQIQHYIGEWSKLSPSNNWALGCYMAQWNINNSYGRGQTQTPFQGVFGACFHDPLRCLPKRDIPLPSVDLSEVIELSDDDMDTHNELSQAIETDKTIRPENEDHLSALHEKTSVESSTDNAGEFIGTILLGDNNDTLVLKECSTNVAGYIQYPNKILSKETENTECINTTEDIEKTLQDDTSEIKVVAVEMSDDDEEADVNSSEMKATVMCNYCNSVMDELTKCEQCNKLVHNSCTKSLMFKNKLSIICFVCLTLIKKRIQSLKEKVREYSLMESQQVV